MKILATIAIALVATPLGLGAQARGGGASRTGGAASSSSAPRTSSSSSAGRTSSSSAQVGRSSGSNRQAAPSSGAQVNRNSNTVTSKGLGSTTTTPPRTGSATRTSPSNAANRASSNAASGQISARPNTTAGSVQGDNRNAASASRTPSTGRTPAASNSTPSTSAGRTPSASRTPAASNSTPSTTERTPATGSRTPAASSRTPASGNRTPAASNRTPATNERTPAVSDRTPAASGRTPATSDRRSDRPRPGDVPQNYRGGEPPRGVVRMDEHRDIHRVPPRMRPPMEYNRPVVFFRPGIHYYGYRILSLPAAITRLICMGIEYYLWDNVYYRMYGNSYYICRPPVGVVFAPDLYEMELAACRFAYYNNVYQTYRTINDNAAIITEQNRIIAQNNATIAAQNAQIALNATKAQASYNKANELGLVQKYADAQVEYFYDDGVFFVKNQDGKYEVIVPPAGALVPELPDDYDTITIGDNEYFKVDDTVFRLTVVDGSAYFEVLGQLTGELAALYEQTA
ncbi:MAG: hypothetical protein IJU63_07890 [Bacteroidales bacterium]|nr:hypothetical protein [Bacteroidales bacterium]